MPTVNAGRIVLAGTPVATFGHGFSSNSIETGWAFWVPASRAPSPTSCTRSDYTQGQDIGNYWTYCGQQFSDLLRSLGAPGGRENQPLSGRAAGRKGISGGGCEPAFGVSSMDVYRCRLHVWGARSTWMTSSTHKGWLSCSVSPSATTVSAYQRRYPAMPRPVVDLGQGRCKLWLRTEIEPWRLTRPGGSATMSAVEEALGHHPSEIVPGDVPGGPSTSQTIMVASLQRLLSLRSSERPARGLPLRGHGGERPREGRQRAGASGHSVSSAASTPSTHESLLFRALRDLWAHDGGANRCWRCSAPSPETPCSGRAQR